MNIHRLFLVGILMMLTGCNSVAPDTQDSIQSTYETTEAIHESKPGTLLITVTPDKKEYTSADNGITWLCDGEKSGTPPIFLTLITENPISFSTESNYIGTLHNFDAGLLEDGFNYEFTRYDNGSWVKADRKTDQISDALEYRLGDGMALDYLFGIYDYEPAEGRYRLTVPFDGYDCSVEFTAVL